MRDRVIRAIEADVVFLEILTQEEKLHISRILLILASFVVLDTNMLMEVYQYFYKDKLKLRFIKKAVKERFIIEYKKNLETDLEEPIYFYELKSSGMHELSEAGFFFIVPGRFWTNEERNAILAFNRDKIKEQGFGRVIMSKEEFKQKLKLVTSISRRKVDGDEFGKYTRATNPVQTIER